MKNTFKENPSQKTRILLYMKAGNKITGMEALNLFDCWRLPARIDEIKKMGFDVNMELITTHTKKVIGQYSLIKEYVQTKLF